MIYNRRFPGMLHNVGGEMETESRFEASGHDRCGEQQQSSLRRSDTRMARRLCNPFRQFTFQRGSWLAEETVVLLASFLESRFKSIRTISDSPLPKSEATLAARCRRQFEGVPEADREFIREYFFAVQRP